MTDATWENASVAFCPWHSGLQKVIGACAGSGIGLWRRRRAAAPAALVAVAAFLVSGSLNTLIDEPRFLGLLLICLWLATVPSVAAGPAAAPRRPASGPSGLAPPSAP